MSHSTAVIGLDTNNSHVTVMGNDSTTGTIVSQQAVPSKIQDVRVDNWGNYCLQRLQAMYERSDHCDLILQFHNNQTIKVHRVVVNMCTDYFANLEGLNGFTNGMLVLPREVEYTAMLVIIKFFYTGKLEVRGAQFSDMYRTVKLMNINILIKLLEAHARKPEEINKRKPTTGQLVVKSGGGGSQVLKSLVQCSVNSKILPGARKPLTVNRPLPAGVKTKTVLARVQQQPVRLANLQHNRSNIRTITSAITPKKLPIWKERKTLIHTQEPPKYVSLSQKVEPARPTRFEWPDPEEEGTGFKTENMPEDFYSQHLPTSGLSQNPSMVFDAVKIQVDGFPSLLKHKLPSDSEDVADSKMAKMSDDIEKELASMEGGTGEHDVGFETSAEEDLSNIMCQEISEHAEVETSIETEPELTLIDNVVQDVAVEEIVKSTPLKKVVKSVRFAAEVEKENKAVVKEGSHSAGVQHVPVPVIECTTGMSREDEPANHSKLISEILKRYPELIKDNKNVKLKIVQKGPPEAGCKEGKSKTSYIVLKSSSSDTPGSVVLKKSSPSPARSKFWDTEDTVTKVSSAAENTIGPWSCVPCGTTDGPEQFDSYFLYRKHLVDVHHEKVDARICEYCGMKTSKRNLLLYHLYTKHAIEPPPTHQFPHCDRCDYIALSWSLLRKHKQAHETAKHLSCTICRASFKTSAALQYHMAANLHRNRDSKGVHQCPYCIKQFARIANLNTHIRSLHNDQIESEPDTGLQEYQTDDEQKMDLNNLISADVEEAGTIDGIEGSINLPIKIIPSSEEALNNVASSIAASLGLGTQIQHEEQGQYTEHILGDAGQEVYVLDNSTVAVGTVEGSDESTMVLGNMDALDSDGDFLVQDIHGNRFRKITATDSEGNPVMFFQLADENGEVSMGDQAVEISEEVATTVANHVEYCFDDKTSLSVQNDHMYLDPQKCSVFASSADGVPVNITSEEMDQTQTLVTYDDGGTQVLELLPLTSVPSDIDNNDGQISEDASDVIVPDNDTDELSYPLNSNTVEEVELEEVSYDVGEVGDSLQEDEVIEIMEYEHEDASEPSIKVDNEEGIIGV